jgi:alpha-glucosidase
MRTIVLALAACAAALAQPGPARVASPDGRAVFELVPGNHPAYRVLWRGKTVVADSALGLETQGQQPLGPGLGLTSVKTGSADETYRTPHGKSNPVRNHYNSLIAEFAGGADRAHSRLAIEARAYDDGVAFRYVIPQQPNLRELRVASEITEFQLAKDADTYPLFLNGFRTS